MEASALRAPAGLTRLSLPSALLRLRSDEQLVALFRQGSDDAFRVIHDRYRQRLFAYTRQMLGGSRSDAEDALQDVFLRAYNALRVDDRPVALKAWLYRVAHNRCIDDLRRPIPPHEAIFEVSRTPMHDPLAEAERRDDLRRLVADVQTLPEQQRSALLMRELEGLSYAELATALDVTVPAVKSLLVRARIGLVEAAEARDIACSDIRSDLSLSWGKGVRASARARKHMRNCQGCRDYRTGLKGVSRGLGALAPSGPSPFGLLAKLLGLGGGAGGAAAGGSAAAGGGAAVVGGGAVAATTAKVAAVVCCAAITAGGAVEIKKHAVAPKDGDARPASAAAKPSAADRARAVRAAKLGERSSPVPVAARVAATRTAGGARSVRAAAGSAAIAAAEADEPISPHYAPEYPSEAPSAASGGALAPADSEAAPASRPSSTQSSAGTSSGSAQPTAVPATASSPPPPPAESTAQPSSSSSADGGSSTGPTATTAAAVATAPAQ